MTVIEQDVTTGVAATPATSRVGWRAWLLQAVLLSLLLVGLARWLGPGVYTIDENAYRVQAGQLVEEGTWGIPLVASPGGVPSVQAPLALSDVRGDVFFPYARHAAYPVALAAVDPVAPANGGLLLSAAALVLVALAAGVVADRLPNVDGRVGFWLAASASPLLIHSHIGWAHLPATAAFTVAFAAFHLSKHWSVAQAAIVVAGLTVAVLLRTEAMIASAALLVAVAVADRSTGERIRWTVTIGASAAGAFFVDRVLFRLATGDVGLAPTGVAESPDPLLVQRLQAAVALFLDVGGVSPQHVARLLGSILLIAAAVLVRRRADVGMVVVLSALSLGLGVYGALNGDPYPGLLAAWPLLGPALVFAGTRRIHRSPQTVLIVTWLALVAVSPPDGGGLGWGGRLGLVVLAVAVPLVAQTLADARSGGNRGHQVVVLTATVIAAVVSVAGLRTVATARETSVVVEAQVTAALAPLIDGDDVLVSTDRRLGRIAPDVAIALPLQSLPDDGELEEFLGLVDAAGVERVLHIDLFDNDDPVIPDGWRASEPRFDETVRTIVIEREGS